MAPPVPATLVHCGVFATGSRARRQRSPGPGTTAREHCRLASCKAVFVVLLLSWWRSQRPGRASPLPRVRPWSLVSPCFWADPSLSPPSTAFFRLPLRLARLAHSPRSRRRHSSNSHSVRAAARGLARSGVYEIAFAVLAATVVPCDLVETSRLSGTRRAQPKKLRECDPAHTVSRRRTAYFSSSASRPRVGGVHALWRAPC